jgi:hypothetical protein
MHQVRYTHRFSFFLSLSLSHTHTLYYDNNKFFTNENVCFVIFYSWAVWGKVLQIRGQNASLCSDLLTYVQDKRKRYLEVWEKYGEVRIIRAAPSCRGSYTAAAFASLARREREAGFEVQKLHHNTISCNFISERIFS